MKKHIFILAIAIFISNTLFSQCYPDRHNTNWYDGWISCETSANPNTIRGNSHWIMYNFDTKYILNNLHVWNTNDPDNLNFGMKNIIIDISEDGISWTDFGNFTLSQASGKSIYEGEDLVNFNGAKAKFLLITAVDNYGGECFGLSEIRIDASPSPVEIEELSLENQNSDLLVDISPNPFSDKTKIKIISSSKEDIYYFITDLTGKNLLNGKVSGTNETSEINIEQIDFSPGSYFLIITQANITQEHKLIVIK